MVKLSKNENGLTLVCECGLIHDVTMDEKEELIVNSTYNKTKGQNGTTEKDTTDGTNDGTNDTTDTTETTDENGDDNGGIGFFKIFK